VRNASQRTVVTVCCSGQGGALQLRGTWV